MAWRKSQNMDGTDWSSEETSKPDRRNFLYTQARSTPNTGKEALWNVVRRCGGPFKWLKADLFMLGVSLEPDNVLVLEAYSEFLRVLGQRLLPKVGAEPLSNVMRARPEAQELSMLLACLATRATPPGEIVEAIFSF